MRIGRAVAVSGALHLALLAGALLAFAPRPVPPPPPAPAPVVELVLNDPGNGKQGSGTPRPPAPPTPAPPTPAPPAPAPPTPAPPTPAPPTPSPSAAPPPPPPPAPSAPTAPEAALPPPAPPAPSSLPQPPAPPAPQATQTPTPPTEATPSVRLGEDGMPGETDEITGPNVAGPTPDHAARNLPPRYPRDAEGRHPEGTVVLRLVVGADGAVAAADVLRSSGHLVLDEAARAAVLRWRFRPALRDGLPVPSALPYSFRFTHDARAPLPDDAPDPTGSVP